MTHDSDANARKRLRMNSADATEDFKALYTQVGLEASRFLASL